MNGISAVKRLRGLLCVMCLIVAATFTVAQPKRSILVIGGDNNGEERSQTSLHNNN